MLAKDYRLNLRFETDYRNQFSRISSPRLILLFQKDTQLPHPKVAILVSKRLSNRAVDRNHYRRFISGLVEKNWNLLSPGLKVIIIPKHQFEFKTYEVESEIKQLFGRLS
jgi:ribonuclease P protein component